ncbi:D-glycero-beta-D-manno-heptose 1,7-bisphosphate 7-phosphatase [Thiospirillum jenense]|uniref:D,D-heptose 1,7-bisphosphate phosphatase n=1 Tax=Thiospirillum jenense TaxID=1653858 RepID=A0A839HEZ4_9GAMM|nr:D-glycero-beta-D-manno-heptose 1,7-bisphosphate 7-phosphatase [Thiospirillum jenense]MBB1127044.1 D-glycero-beta-D-manno-heptose 1,7-bisphosphate 7-phosphatase [Thiospirillum jenense]
MKLVILDRDGVINQDSDAYIKSPEEWIPLPGSVDAIARLNHAGWTVAIATNQSGVARGLFDLTTLDRIHQRMRDYLAAGGARIDAIAFCPHAPEAACQCRKPQPGLLQSLAQRFHTNLINVPMIGDSWRDVEAAMTVKANPLLVLTGKGGITEKTHRAQLNDVTVIADLRAAVDLLINE